MRQMKKITGISFIIVLSLLAGNIWAEVVAININATINYIDDSYNLLKDQLHVDDTITGSYTYNSATTDSNPAIEFGDYWHYNSPYGITLSGGGFIFKTDPASTDFLLEMCNNYGSLLMRDSYLLMSYNNLPLYQGVPVSHISWQLDDYSGTALSSVMLPTTAPVLTNWINSGLVIRGNFISEDVKKGYSVRATVTSTELVPEPATLLLLGLGGLILGKRS